MAINLTTLAGKLAKVEVDFMGQSAKITYDPMKMTQEAVDAGGKSDQAFVEFFCDVVKSWDVTRSGKKVPLTPNGVKGVPMVLLKAIYVAIMRDGAQGDPDEGKA